MPTDSSRKRSVRSFPFVCKLSTSSADRMLEQRRRHFALPAVVRCVDLVEQRDGIGNVRGDERRAASRRVSLSNCGFGGPSGLRKYGILRVRDEAAQAGFFRELRRARVCIEVRAARVTQANLRVRLRIELPHRPRTARRSRRRGTPQSAEGLEATPRLELGMELLQSSALPLGYVAVPSIVSWSGWRESNPRVNLGKVAGCHYITPAFRTNACGSRGLQTRPVF